jgi:hypothetical protein
MGALNMIELQRGLPMTIKTDKGSAFIGKAMDRWEGAVQSNWTSTVPASPGITRE